MKKIIIDGLGGDHPEENKKAYDEMLHRFEDAKLVITDGNTPYESLQKAFKLLKSTENSVLVSMGETRDLIIGAMNHIGVKETILRPVLCPVIPTVKGGVVGLCDSGAIVNTSPDHILQYAFIGSDFMKKAYKIESPRVALLNIGVEEEKGDELHREAFKLLKKEGEAGKINFIGNIEARDYQSGICDLVVSDGFSGNVMIKAVEGICEWVINNLGKYIPKDDLELMNYRNFAGSTLLGVNKPIIKVHGFGDKEALKTAIIQAYNYC